MVGSRTASPSGLATGRFALRGKATSECPAGSRGPTSAPTRSSKGWPGSGWWSRGRCRCGQVRIEVRRVEAAVSKRLTDAGFRVLRDTDDETYSM